MTDRIRRAAEHLAAARLTRVPVVALADELRPDSEMEGYTIQDALHERLEPQLGGFTRHKIGCLTRKAQDAFRLGRPCAAGIPDSDVWRLHGRFRWKDFIRVGVEAEVAVRLARDIRPVDRPYTREDVASAVASYMVAIEVVDDRYEDEPRRSTPTLIADDFFAAACVLGREMYELDSAQQAAAVAMTIDGRPVRAPGGDDDQPGDLLDALAWLANHQAARGRPLGAGEFVLLGSPMGTHWLDGASEVVVDSATLGTVTATVV